MGVVVFIQVRASRGTRPTVTCNITERISREQLGFTVNMHIWINYAQWTFNTYPQYDLSKTAHSANVVSHVSCPISL